MKQRELNHKLIKHLLNHFGEYRCKEERKKHSVKNVLQLNYPVRNDLIGEYRHFKQGTIDALLQYLNNRLAEQRKPFPASAPATKHAIGSTSTRNITADMLYLDYDGELPPELCKLNEFLLPAGLSNRQVAASAKQSAFVPPPRFCEMYETQYAAEDVITPHLDGLSNITTVTLVDFSCHVMRPFIQRLLRCPRIDWLEVFMGAEKTASAISSTRQSKLIRHHKHSEFNTDLQNSGRVRLTQFTSPPSFRGFHIHGFAVCMGWYFWFPMFRNLDHTDPQVKKSLDDLVQNGIVPPDITDEYTIDAHNMPHALAFKQPDDDTTSSYHVMSQMFDLHVQTIRSYANLTSKE